MSLFDEPDHVRTDEEVIELVEDQRDLLIAVATGTSITAELDRDYARRRRAITQALEARRMRSPFRWPDLRQFWAAVAAPAMTTYRERRAYVHDLVRPTIDRLERSRSGVAIEDWGETNDAWAAIDERIDGLRREFAAGDVLDDWQDVGRRAREILIDLANLVYRTDMLPADSQPQGSNAKAKLEAYLTAAVSGANNAELRAAVRASWDLANKVTHGASQRYQAFAAAQAALMIVRTVVALESERA